jgi:hypothetical protein
MGLPMYVAINQKPESRCEIQNAACGRSGVILQLHWVKTKKENRTSFVEIGLTSGNHGTNICRKLVLSWRHTNTIVCANSYFASINCCESLLSIGLKSIGVVKTAPKWFMKQYLQAQLLQEKINQHTVLHKDNKGVPDMFAFVWLDR